MALRNVNDFVLGTISGQEQTTDFQLIAKVDDSVTFSTVQPVVKTWMNTKEDAA